MQFWVKTRYIFFLFFHFIFSHSSHQRKCFRVLCECKEYKHKRTAQLIQHRPNFIFLQLAGHCFKMLERIKNISRNNGHVITTQETMEYIAICFWNWRRQQWKTICKQPVLYLHSCIECILALENHTKKEIIFLLFFKN